MNLFGFSFAFMLSGLLFVFLTIVAALCDYIAGCHCRRIVEKMWGISCSVFGLGLILGMIAVKILGEHQP